MLLNLVSNAVKFTQKGGHVSVAIELLPRGQLRLAVIDNGIGMSPDDLEVALLPFGQVDSSLSRNHQGTGLGLPLTKAMIERHGGTMAIDSAAGKGTVATLLFPPDRVIRS
jgi:signal transduction histidine kinase